MSILWEINRSLILASRLLLAAGVAVAEPVILEQVRLIDPDHGSVSDPVDLGVLHGAITPLAELPAGAKRVSTAGLYVIPGLAEMHAHVPPMRAGEQQIADVMILYLAHGITTIRGMLGESGHLVLREQLAAPHEAGAVILLGADAPQIFNVPGDSVHHELEIYVEVGMSPAEALATGTTNVARYLNQAERHGCLVAGCVADLVVLRSNPLEDISNAREIEGVMRAGRWFDRAELDELLDGVARRAAGKP